MAKMHKVGARNREQNLTAFRIIDLRATTIQPEIERHADSPEKAAEEHFGMRLFRSGKKADLVCRIYWHSREDLNMVRLYSRPREGGHSA